MEQWLDIPQRRRGYPARPTDNINTNGYNIGWTAAGEWMQYSVYVAQSALYDVEVRVAGGQTGGKFHLAAGEADISRHCQRAFHRRVGELADAGRAQRRARRV